MADDNIFGQVSKAYRRKFAEGDVRPDPLQMEQVSPEGEFYSSSDIGQQKMLTDLRNLHAMQEYGRRHPDMSEEDIHKQFVSLTQKLPELRQSRMQELAPKEQKMDWLKEHQIPEELNEEGKLNRAKLLAPIDVPENYDTHPMVVQSRFENMKRELNRTPADLEPPQPELDLEKKPLPEGVSSLEFQKKRK